MKKIIALFILFVICGTELQSKSNDNHLYKFAERIKRAADISFMYRVNTLDGVVSIAKDALYISQRNKLEIFETPTTRYIYNRKRNKVDIDSINNNSNNISILLDWIQKIDDYEISSKGKGDKGLIKYRLKGTTPKEEVIEVTFSAAGDIVELSYQSTKMKRMTVHISNFKVDERPTKSFFTFNPEERKDIEVTDYR